MWIKIIPERDGGRKKKKKLFTVASETVDYLFFSEKFYIELERRN